MTTSVWYAAEQASTVCRLLRLPFLENVFDDREIQRLSDLLKDSDALYQRQGSDVLVAVDCGSFLGAARMLSSRKWARVSSTSPGGTPRPGAGAMGRVDLRRRPYRPSSAAERASSRFVPQDKIS